MMSYVKNTGLAAGALVALLTGGGLIAVIFDAISWSDLGDWVLKAVLVAVVLVVVSGVIGAISSAAGNKK